MEQPEQNVIASPQLAEPAAQQQARPAPEATGPGVTVFDTQDVSIYYGSFRAVTDVSLSMY